MGHPFDTIKVSYLTWSYELQLITIDEMWVFLVRRWPIELTSSTMYTRRTLSRSMALLHLYNKD